jgi:hypothetical protein
MLEFLTKDVDLEAIEASILAALRRRNFEADGLLSHLHWKAYHVEMALNRLIRTGRVVSFWTDSGPYQRHFYALTENFDKKRPVMQICASPDALEKLGEIKLTSRLEMRQKA